MPDDGCVCVHCVLVTEQGYLCVCDIVCLSLNRAIRRSSHWYTDSLQYCRCSAADRRLRALAQVPAQATSTQLRDQHPVTADVGRHRVRVGTRSLARRGIAAGRSVASPARRTAVHHGTSARQHYACNNRGPVS